MKDTEYKLLIMLALDRIVYGIIVLNINIHYKVFFHMISTINFLKVGPYSSYSFCSGYSFQVGA